MRSGADDSPTWRTLDVMASSGLELPPQGHTCPPGGFVGRGQELERGNAWGRWRREARGSGGLAPAERSSGGALVPEGTGARKAGCSAPVRSP